MDKEISNIGIDIGGAHLKIVGLNNNDQVIYVKYTSCKIWENIENLNKEFEQINQIVGRSALCAITMTAELCDNFTSRQQGAEKLIKKCELLKIDKYFYINSSKIFSKNPKFSELISMNWHSIGRYLEKKIKSCVAIDFGSTSTDILCIKNHKLLNKFYDDYSRLNNNELIYTGLTRTPLFGVSNSIKINKTNMNIIPEYFSDMSDIYRILQKLDSSYDIDKTADGRSKSLYSSLKRVSRSFGFDYKKENLGKLLEISNQLKEIQLTKIFATCLKNIQEYSLTNEPIIVSGIGQNILSDFLSKKGIYTVKFQDFLKKSKLNNQASFHAPALSIALLLKTLK